MLRKTCHRFNNVDEAHALTFSCFRRRQFLSRPRTCRYVLEALALGRRKHPFHLWGYVIMPEHVHVLVWPTEFPYDVSAFLRTVKQSVSRRALIYLRRDNPLGLQLLATGQKHVPYRFWLDGGGYDQNLTDASSVHRMLEYIHNNPVRRGLAAYAEDWPWSSVREWAGDGPSPVGQGHLSIQPSLNALWTSLVEKHLIHQSCLDRRRSLRSTTGKPDARATLKLRLRVMSPRVPDVWSGFAVSSC